MYPLHYACKQSPYVSVIQLLFCEYPRALTQQCSTSYLQHNPLHWLCCNTSISLELCFASSSQSLLPIERIAQSQRQSGGCTPLHLACKHNQSVETICRCVEPLFHELDDGNLKPIAIPDVSGYLPLHLACEYEQSFEAIEYLIEMYPAGVKHASKDGWLPLHMACANGQSLRVIQLLIATYPFTLMQRTHDEGCLPIEIAEESEARQETILYLQTQASDIRFRIFEYLLSTSHHY